jgi:hypothetical protein
MLEHWQGKMTPLIWEHINPYGRFDLDMAPGLIYRNQNGG